MNQEPFFNSALAVFLAASLKASFDTNSLPLAIGFIIKIAIGRIKIIIKAEELKQNKERVRDY